MARCPSHDDHRASLSISESSDGHLLLHCHAGCEFEKILAAVSCGSGRIEVACCDYRDEMGHLLYQSVRYDPKDFRQRRPDSAGGWAWNLNGTRRVLYRLTELLAADPDRVVFIVEGEKDCHQLVEIGLVATTNSGGAGKWRSEYNEPLRGRHVVILPDNDEPGRKHAQAIANSLLDIASSIRVVHLPGLREKGDVTDWLAAGNGIEALRELVEGTAPLELISDNEEQVDGHEDGPATGTADDEVLRQLAKLSPLEYERQRLTAAKTLKCRPSTLDKLIGALRPPRQEGGLQGREVELADVQLWPEPVTGQVLNEVSETFLRYLALPPGAADILAVWCAHAHVYELFTCTPRLNITSPEARCGKTLARDVVHQFVPRPLSTENLTVAVIFRLIESRQPTILADEYDTWIHGYDELRGMLNAGHRRGGQALRCEGDGNEVRAFNVFGPAVLCGIGSLPGTLNDRAIKVRLQRAKPGELRERFDSRHIEREQKLCKLARWCSDNRGLIESCDPTLPDAAYNRVADNWRPIFAIAEVAGGDWPQRITDAFTKQSCAETDDEGLASMLLADIRQIFNEDGVDRMFSKEMVERLLSMTDRPWPEGRKEKPIHRNLARQAAQAV